MHPAIINIFCPVRWIAFPVKIHYRPAYTSRTKTSWLVLVEYKPFLQAEQEQGEQFMIPSSKGWTRILDGSRRNGFILYY